MSSPYEGYRVVTGWFSPSGVKTKMNNDYVIVDSEEQARQELDALMGQRMNVHGSAWGRIEKVEVLLETERRQS